MEQKERIERLAKHLWETSKIKTHGAFITWERMEETIGRADKTKKYWRLKAEAALLAMDGGGGGKGKGWSRGWHRCKCGGFKQHRLTCQTNGAWHE